MTLEEVGEMVADHMDTIHTYFKPGVKVTVMVRVPGFPERDFMMTADDLTEVAAMVARRAAAEKTP
jgi:hypothetical protein